MGSLNQMDQLGLEDLLSLMREHERHMREFGTYFANFREYVNRELELWPILGDEARRQIVSFGNQFVTAINLQDEITETLLDLAETLIAQQIN